MQKITRNLMLVVATFSLAFSAKSQTGNNCSSAINIPLSTSSSTCLSNSTSNASIWYKFTAIRSVTNFVVNSPGGAINNAHVYTGACNSLVELGATVDEHGDSTKIFINILSAGQVYYIRLDKNADAATATFTVCSSPAEQLPWQVTGNDVQFAGKIGATSATLSSLAGSGNRLLQTNSVGNILPFAMGNSSQVLLGDGTWGSLPGVPYTVSGGNTTFGGSVTANGLTSTGDITGENLTINSNSTFNGRMNINSFAGGGKRLLMTADDGSIFALTSGNPHDVLFGNGTWGSFPQPIQLWAPNDDATTINYNGMVGINNPDPRYELDVAGNAYVSGNLYVGRGVVISQSTAVNPKLLIQASELLTSKLNVDTISMDSSARFTGTAVFENQVNLRDQLKVTSDATFSSAVQVQTALRVGGAATFSTSIDVGQNLTFKNASAGIGYVPAGSAIPTPSVNTGTIVLSSNANVWGDLTVNGNTSFNQINATQQIAAPKFVTSHIVAPDTNGIHLGDSSMIFTSGAFDNMRSGIGRLSIGSSTKAIGVGSIAMGSGNSETDGTTSMALGFNVKTGSTATHGIAIGAGITTGAAMTNSTPNSLAIGLACAWVIFFKNLL